MHPTYYFLVWSEVNFCWLVMRGSLLDHLNQIRESSFKVKDQFPDLGSAKEFATKHGYKLVARPTGDVSPTIYRLEKMEQETPSPAPTTISEFWVVSYEVDDEHSGFDFYTGVFTSFEEAKHFGSQLKEDENTGKVLIEHYSVANGIPDNKQLTPIATLKPTKKVEYTWE